MIRKTLLLLSFATVCSPYFSFSQTNAHDNLSNYYIQGNGANLNNIYKEDINADLYTGSLRPSFKLYSYDNNTTGLHHQISLNYDGTGVLVDNIASEVGLNWSLYYGGYITREIRGLPDDDDSGFANTHFEPSNTDLTGYVRGINDGEFDIYHFAVGDITGQFIIGKNGQIITIPSSNIKIQRIGTGSTNAPIISTPYSYSFPIFQITIESGARYVFGVSDCISIPFINQTKYAYTTLYLTKIIAPFSQDSIVLNWYPGSVVSYADDSVYTSYSQVDTDGNGYLIATGQHACGDPQEIEYNNSLPFLNNITYPDGTIVSTNLYNIYRLDYRNFVALKNLTVSNGSESYGYQFNYDYTYRDTGGSVTSDWAFQDYTNTSTWTTYAGLERYFSLQLINFHMFSGADTLPGYTFIYNPMGLPHRNATKAVDLWGYFNGNQNDTRLTCSGLRYNITTSHWESVLSGGSRTPNIQFAIAKSLKQIILPTGGNIRFDYEPRYTSSIYSSSPDFPSAVFPNFGTVAGGLRIKRITRSDTTGQSNALVREFSYVDQNNVTTGIMANYPVMSFLYNETYSSSSPYSGFNLVSYCSNSLNLPWIDQSPNTFTFLVRSGQPLNTLAYTHGSPVGYSQVTEFNGTSTNYKNKTVYNFTTAANYSYATYINPNSLSFPFPPLTDMDFCYGLLVSKASYNAGGLETEQINNTYATYLRSVTDSNFVGLKVGLAGYIGNISYQNYHSFCSTAYYYPFTGKIFLTQTTDQQFFSYGKTITSFKKTIYDTANNVPRSVVTTDATGDTISYLYYYPYNFSISGAISTLNTKGIIYSPIRTEKWQMTPAQQVLDANAVNYGNFGSLVKPSSVYNFASTTPVSGWSFNSLSLLPPSNMVQNATMDQYDAYGNLIQSTVKSRVSSAIWDYKYHYPTAKVANAAASDIAYTSFEASPVGAVYGGWSSAGGFNVLNTNAITGKSSASYVSSGNGLYKENLDQSKTYIVSVWSTSSAPQISVYNNPLSPTSLTAVTSDSHNGWTLYKATFSGYQALSVSLSPGMSIDELRLYPLGSAMTTFSYDPLFKVKTSETDASNRTTYYEYDDFGRLKYVRDLDKNIIKAYDYVNQEPQY